MVSNIKEIKEIKEKAEDALKGVHADVVEENIGIVLDTVERINKTNTTSKADNIQRGVNDARKVLGLFSVVRAVLSIFKKK